MENEQSGQQEIIRQEENTDELCAAIKSTEKQYETELPMRETMRSTADNSVSFLIDCKAIQTDTMDAVIVFQS